MRVRKHFLKTTQLDEFEVGQVRAYLQHKLGPATISKIIFRPDGKSQYSETPIADCIKKLKANPKWRGERQKRSGRPRKTTKAQDAALVKKLIAVRPAGVFVPTCALPMSQRLRNCYLRTSSTLAFSCFAFRWRKSNWFAHILVFSNSRISRLRQSSPRCAQRSHISAMQPH